MMPRERCADLFRYVESRGWLGAAPLGKARLLCELGLHPEQSLVGAGLLKAESYGEALSDLFGLPFRRVDADAFFSKSELIEELRPWKAVPLQESEREIAVGFAEPWDDRPLREAESWAHAQSRRLTSFSVLWSDVRRLSAPKPLFSTARRLRNLFQLADTAQTHHVRLSQGCEGTEATLCHDVRQSPSLLFASAPFSAMRLRMQRTADAFGWQTESWKHGNGHSVLLSRKAGALPETHPLEWSSVWRSFWQKPEGLLVLRGQQPLWRQKMLAASGQALCFEVEDPSAGEEAAHAALRGRAVVARSSLAEPWWEPVREAGVPVRIVSFRAQPEGTAWEASLL